MAKQRFRDIKQGKVIPLKEKPNKKEKENTIYNATSRDKIKAFLTDAFMLVMPIMFIVFYLVMDGREDFEQHKILGWTWILIPLVIIQTIFMYRSGQTPGYRNYRITLIDDHTGERPTLFIILFRNATAILSLFTILGWALMFFRKDNKNLHDILSATSVIRTNDKTK
jgi:uncharacterized RDD family membrane protein YckC